MGLKFTDLLILGHDHKKTLNYFYKGGLEEILGYKVDQFKWEQKSFPMARTLGIDKHEVCTWITDQGHESELILESNKKLPWLRIATRFAELYTPHLIKALLELNPQAFIGQFDYISTSDSAYIFIEKAKGSAFITWDGENNQIEWMGYDGSKKETLPIHKKLRPCGEELIVHYWQKFFTKIPLRYHLTEPSTEFIELVEQNIFL